MAGILYADSIGGIGAAMQADESLRQQAWQNAMATLMRQREQAQAQRNFEMQMGERAMQNMQDRQLRNATLTAAETDRADTLAYRNRGLKLSEDYQDWLMKQPTKAASKNILERQAAATQESQAGTFDPSNYADLPPEHLGPLTRIDASQREQDAAALAKATEVAIAANALKHYDRRMKEIKDSPGFMVTGNLSKPETSPEALKRVQEIRDNISPLLKDPKLKIVDTDPTTGNYIPPANLIKPWMKMGTNTPAAVLNGRQLNIAPAAGAATPLLPPQARAFNDTIRVKLSDGRILNTTSANMPAVLARDPGAVVAPYGFARGGTVPGVGSPTSDRVTIKASPGEFILPAESMQVPGALQAVENLRRTGLAIRAARGTPRFAVGGMVPYDYSNAFDAGLLGQSAGGAAGAMADAGGAMAGGAASGGGFNWMGLIMNLLKSRQASQPKPNLFYNPGYPTQGF